MTLSCRSLQAEPAAGHSVHARTHVHYETGDHQAGLDWLHGWIHGVGQSSDNLAHYSWHAALHELWMGDFRCRPGPVRRRAPPPTVVGCRALVDSCSLLWRWTITPGAVDVPEVKPVAAVIEDDLLDRSPTPFMALHSRWRAALGETAAGAAGPLGGPARDPTTPRCVPAQRGAAAHWPRVTRARRPTG